MIREYEFDGLSVYAIILLLYSRDSMQIVEYELGGRIRYSNGIVRFDRNEDPLESCCWRDALNELLAQNLINQKGKSYSFTVNGLERASSINDKIGWDMRKYTHRTVDELYEFLKSIPQESV